MKTAVHRFCSAVIAASLIFSWISSGRALGQSIQSADLISLQADQFPQITALLDVHQADGQFAHGLRPENVRVLENGQTLPVKELKELQTGVQLVIAISLGPAMAIRDSQGRSRLDYLIQGLNAWESETNELGKDDISLLAQDGPEVIHVSLPTMIKAALRDYRPDARRAVPSLEVLSRALQVVSDPLPRPGMERIVLYITPLQSPETWNGLKNFADQANQLGTRLFVWLVASPADFTLPAKDVLQNMAIQSKGDFLTFSGTESIPNLDEYLEPFRHIYQLTYTSALKSSGDYPVSIEIELNEQLIATSALNLSLQISPPNPIFISPPTEILRTAEKASFSQKGPAIQTSAIRLLPEKHTIEIFVEFPDGHARSLIQSAFYVDGQLIEEKFAPPFNRFNWDLSAYHESGMHSLRVEVTDSLGLTGSSVDMPVRITIQPPSGRIEGFMPKKTLLLIGIIVLTTSLVLGLVLILAGRLQPTVPGKAKTTTRLVKKASAIIMSGTRTRDEASQPVPVQSLANRFPRWSLRLIRVPGHTHPQPLATLTLVLPGEEVPHTAPVPITVNEIIFGRDAAQATWVIDDPSLEPLHARLIREGDTFRIFDLGSTAGTWVNYSPVPDTGVMLEHGDLIHIGRIGLRFMFRSSGRIPKPILIPPGAKL